MTTSAHFSTIPPQFDHPFDYNGEIRGDNDHKLTFSFKIEDLLAYFQSKADIHFCDTPQEVHLFFGSPQDWSTVIHNFFSHIQKVAGIQREFSFEHKLQTFQINGFRLDLPLKKRKRSLFGKNTLPNVHIPKDGKIEARFDLPTSSGTITFRFFASESPINRAFKNKGLDQAVDLLSVRASEMNDLQVIELMHKFMQQLKENQKGLQLKFVEAIQQVCLRKPHLKKELSQLLITHAKKFANAFNIATQTTLWQIFRDDIEKYPDLVNIYFLVTLKKKSVASRELRHDMARQLAPHSALLSPFKEVWAPIFDTFFQECEEELKKKGNSDSAQEKERQKDVKKTASEVATHLEVFKEHLGDHAKTFQDQLAQTNFIELLHKTVTTDASDPVKTATNLAKVEEKAKGNKKFSTEVIRLAVVSTTLEDLALELYSPSLENLSLLMAAATQQKKVSEDPKEKPADQLTSSPLSKRALEEFIRMAPDLLKKIQSVHDEGSALIERIYVQLVSIMGREKTNVLNSDFSRFTPHVCHALTYKKGATADILESVLITLMTKNEAFHSKDECVNFFKMIKHAYLLGRKDNKRGKVSLENMIRLLKFGNAQTRTFISLPRNSAIETLELFKPIQAAIDEVETALSPEIRQTFPLPQSKEKKELFSEAIAEQVTILGNIGVAKMRQYGVNPEKNDPKGRKVNPIEIGRRSFQQEVAPITTLFMGYRILKILSDDSLSPIFRSLLSLQTYREEDLITLVQNFSTIVPTVGRNSRLHSGLSFNIIVYTLNAFKHTQSEAVYAFVATLFNQHNSVLKNMGDKAHILCHIDESTLLFVGLDIVDQGLQFIKAETQSEGGRAKSSDLQTGIETLIICLQYMINAHKKETLTTFERQEKRLEKWYSFFELKPDGTEETGNLPHARPVAIYPRQKSTSQIITEAMATLRLAAKGSTNKEIPAQIKTLNLLYDELLKELPVPESTFLKEA